MAYTTYFDLSLRPGQADPDEAPAWDRLGRVWRIIHVAGRQAGAPFAVAFPGWMRDGFGLGPTLRVFVEDGGVADRLYDAIERAPGIGALVNGSRVRIVPEAPQSFEAYLMHRISSGISKTRKTIPTDVQQTLRESARLRRLTQQKGLPFVRMRSSTGHGFRLVVERIAAAGDAKGVPNGYGLSRTTQVVALPVV
ncbi:MAG: type I-F CRISPR-associated endoribonuclease Cas6/Csy4 [Gammaproteobacteria bacterium]|nr:type I-F CRISPR-associated endoribonuclease Cas6/Csy4 [Gammaproteobacteria bacterium]